MASTRITFYIYYLLIISPSIHVYAYYMVSAKLLQENDLKFFFGRSHMVSLGAKTSQWRPLQVAPRARTLLAIPQIRQCVRGQVLALQGLYKQFSSFITYHRLCTQIKTTGVTHGTGTAYLSEASEFTPGFQWGSCYSVFSFITNKQTNAILSIKTPTMSSIINKKSQYTIDSHNSFFIGQDNTKKKSKKNHIQ